MRIFVVHGKTFVVFVDVHNFIADRAIDGDLQTSLPEPETGSHWIGGTRTSERPAEGHAHALPPGELFISRLQSIAAFRQPQAVPDLFGFYAVA